jgi:hypothetical protein
MYDTMLSLSLSTLIHNTSTIPAYAPLFLLLLSSFAWKRSEGDVSDGFSSQVTLNPGDHPSLNVPCIVDEILVKEEDVHDDGDSGTS